MRWGIVFIFIFNFFSAHTQEKVSFFAGDSLKITADLYLNDYQKPFIILLHQDDASRGEYNSIAPKLLNFGYNCLAVDLRSGDKINYITDETAERARQQHKPTRLIDAKLDIDAAIKYIRKFNRKPVVLFGSSYSASLALIIGNKSKDVSAVIAFSPGEYFLPGVEVKKQLKGFSKPVFAAGTQIEYLYVAELLSEIPDSLKTLYKPSNSRGVHGAKALWDDSGDSKECWFQLTYFFGRLKEL